MSTSKSTAEQIAEIEEKRKQLAERMRQIKRREEAQNDRKYKRIGKCLVEDFSDSPIADIPDTAEGASEFVNQVMAERGSVHDEDDIEQVFRDYIAAHTFARARADDDGAEYAEPFSFDDLLIQGEQEGRYYHINLPAELARMFLGPAGRKPTDL